MTARSTSFAQEVLLKGDDDELGNEDTEDVRLGEAADTVLEALTDGVTVTIVVTVNDVEALVDTDGDRETADVGDGDKETAAHAAFAHANVCVRAAVSGRPAINSDDAPSSCSVCVVARSAQSPHTSSLARLVKTTD